MTEAPTAGKFSYRQLAEVAKAEAAYRRLVRWDNVGRRLMTMADADDAIEAMEDIADILDWLADREIEIAEDGESGW